MKLCEARLSLNRPKSLTTASITYTNSIGDIEKQDGDQGEVDDDGESDRDGGHCRRCNQETERKYEE